MMRKKEPAGTGDALSGLPLVELHCHADGLLDPALARALTGGERTARELKPPIPLTDSAAGWKSTIPSSRASSLPPAERLPGIFLTHVERRRAQGAVYAEIFAGRAIPGIAFGNNNPRRGMKSKRPHNDNT